MCIRQKFLADNIGTLLQVRFLMCATYFLRHVHQQKGIMNK